ncbi:MAG: DUF1080 domain-containing protein [Lacunisphaera sp.]
MKLYPLSIGGFALLALAAAADDFKPLYNGRDLAGWHVKDALPNVHVWKADGEILRVEPGPKGAGGWLTSDREYGDFVLRLEWKIPKNGNSGVGLRYPAEGEPAHEGMEIQLLDDASSDNAQRPPEELTGSLYVEEAPLHKADKPVGEWNTMEITCQRSLLGVRTNGVETLHLNLDNLKILHGHHRQYKPVSERPPPRFPRPAGRSRGEGGIQEYPDQGAVTAPAGNFLVYSRALLSMSGARIE